MKFRYEPKKENPLKRFHSLKPGQVFSMRLEPKSDEIYMVISTCTEKGFPKNCIHLSDGSLCTYTSISDVYNVDCFVICFEENKGVE
jgi:hypothetical protein